MGITGGIGSGKSYVCRLLEERGIPVFYCDPEARIEIQTNEDIRRGLSDLIGPDVYLDAGTLNKPLMRSFMMRSPENVSRINGIVHPRVLQRMRRWIETRPQPVVAVECALLFESGFDRAVSHRVVVSAPEAVRLQRVMERDGIDEAAARKWMSWQMSEKEKCSRADFVIINDGMAGLGAQIDSLLSLKG